MKKILIAVGAILLLAGVAGAAGTDSFGLTVVSQTSTTITFSYPQQDGYGYLYSANGAVVSRTNDPTKTQIKFAKNSQNSYEVAALVKGATGSYQAAPPPPPPPPPAITAPANLRVTASDQTSISVAWDAVTNATNYRIYRNGVLLGQGPGSSGGYEDSWADSGLTCGTSYTYAVDAQDASGNTSPQATLTTATAACDAPAPPPPSGGGQSITPTQFQGMVVAGGTVDGYTITGNVTINASNFTLKNSSVQGEIRIGDSTSGVKILNSSARDFYTEGADNVTLDGNTFDGKIGGQECQNFIWGSATNMTTGWTITNNLFKNYTCSNPHSEALYIGGYARDITVSGNTFYNNGNTAHIFITWCAPSSCSNTGNNPDARDPKNICVKGNTFQETWQAYFDVMIRQEANAPNGHGIYTDDNIIVQPGQPFVNSSTDPGFGVHGVVFMADDTAWAYGSC